MSLTGLGFVSVYAFGLLMALARHPIYGLMVYVLVMFLHPPSRWWGADLPGIRWSMIAALVTLVALQLSARKLAKPKIGLSKQGIFLAYFFLVTWMLVQWPWAIWSDVHAEILLLYTKYLVLIYLIYYVIDSDEKMRMFLWAYILGCAYLGWIAYTTHIGGRFEGFGGPDIGEANAGALTLVTGVFAAGPIFLVGTIREKIVLVGLMPLILNGMVTAASRSAFLSLVTGGLVYLYFSPARFRGRIAALGVLGLVLFVMLTNPFFWGRMGTLKHAGEDVVVETVAGSKADAGYGRVVLLKAQWNMFLRNPLGQGHRATAALSRFYLDDGFLTGSGENRARSSHNTFMTMLVEHGVLGAAVYIGMIWWCVKKLNKLQRANRYDAAPFRVALVPSVAAILAGITIADGFVDYIKLEPRIWFIAVLMVILNWKGDTVPSPPRSLVAGR